MLQVWVLCDNLVNRRGFLAEHGLSLWLERDDGVKILFDTGQTGLWLRNARALGIRPEEANAVVLSHGHYDHCGGLADFPFQAGGAMVYLNPRAFSRKFTRDRNGAFREIGMPWKPGDSRESEGRVAATGGKMEILPGVWTLEENGRFSSFETVPDCFFTEGSGGMVPDRMNDEQLLVVREGDGLAVFSGCSHRGIVNCVEQVHACFPGKKIRFLAAGMHLSGEGEERVRATAEYLAASEIETVVPLHCTGIAASAEIRRALADRCLLAAVGDRISADGTTEISTGRLDEK